MCRIAIAAFGNKDKCISGFIDVGELVSEATTKESERRAVVKEISAGGVVVNGKNVLVLRKFRGDWVLPKGRIEPGESLEETALREVGEESGMNCRINQYIGFVRYNYKKPNGEEVHKTVHYYTMTAEGGEMKPQREEGFCDSAFMPWRKALKLLRHDSERNMVRQAFTSAFPSNRGRRPRTNSRRNLMS